MNSAWPIGFGETVASNAVAGRESGWRVQKGGGALAHDHGTWVVFA